MYSLTFKTRYNRYPGRKPRVLLCGHPEDSNLFKTIANDILSQADCTVWMMEGQPDNDCEWKSLINDLSEMQVVVVLITARFLSHDSFVSRHLIPFLIQEKKSFLPFVMDTDCTQLFVKRYGDIHYFSVSDRFSDGKPIGEKLSLYLNSRFHSRSKEHIHCAFQSRIFLSYRKKDRKYARAFMKQLHDDTRFEDVAVWYDEYLIPGEDFNDEIRDHIRECDFFVLLVTPSLLEKDNYVLTKEYPFARSLEKSIIPCIVKSTDLDDLQKLYKHIPAPVFLDEAKHLLSLSMGDHSEIAKTPQQLYYLGYAYFLGIEVETDRERGKKLIHHAADAGCEDAMYLMAEDSQYQWGASARKQTVFWRKRLIEIAEEKAVQSEDPEAIRRVIVQNHDLGRYYAETGDFRAAISYAKESERQLKRFQERLDVYEVIYSKLQISTFIASLRETTGDLSRCMSQYTDIIESVEKLDDSRKDYPITRQSMLAKMKLGDLFFKKRDFASAQRYYQSLYIDSLACYEDLKENRLKLPPETVQTQISGHLGGDASMYSMDTIDQMTFSIQKDHAVILTKLGDISLEIGKTDQALQLYVQAEQILDGLIQMEMKFNTLRREIGLLHRKKSDIYGDQHKYESALQEVQHAIQIGEELLFISETQQHISDIAVYYYQQGMIYQALQKLKLARSSYQKALYYVNTLSVTPFSRSFRKMLQQALR